MCMSISCVSAISCKSYATCLILEWKLEPDAKAAAKMFQTHLLKDADQKPTLKLTLDMHVTEEDREIAIIGYKQTNIDWTRPFEVQVKGM